MKKILICALLTGIFLFVDIPKINAESFSLSDVTADRWSYIAISNVVDNGLINGFEDGSFKPEKEITRAEAVSILNNYLQKNNRIVENDLQTYFPDIPRDAWYSQSLFNVSSLGIITGDENGNFNPTKSLTRAEMVSIINRMEHYEAKSEEQFWDVDEKAWYSEDVKIAYSNGIINGVSNISFQPNKNVTREQFAIAINNVLNFNIDFVPAEILPFVDMDYDGKRSYIDVTLYEILLEKEAILKSLGYSTNIIPSEREVYATKGDYIIDYQHTELLSNSSGTYFYKEGFPKLLYTENMNTADGEEFGRVAYALSGYGNPDEWYEALYYGPKYLQYHSKYPFMWDEKYIGFMVLGL